MSSQSRMSPPRFLSRVRPGVHPVRRRATNACLYGAAAVPAVDGHEERLVDGVRALRRLAGERLCRVFCDPHHELLGVHHGVSVKDAEILAARIGDAWLASFTTSYDDLARIGARDQQIDSVGHGRRWILVHGDLLADDGSEVALERHVEMIEVNCVAPMQLAHLAIRSMRAPRSPSP